MKISHPKEIQEYNVNVPLVTVKLLVSVIEIQFDALSECF